jgi:hypothetical protein
MLCSIVTHEMVTPLKCILLFTDEIKKDLDSSKTNQAELIISTTKLLLSQVKLLLDKNMIENNLFTLNLEECQFNKTINGAIVIL